MSFISVELSRRDQYTVKTIFRDAFLDSLNNPEMRIKILEKGATTINEAYTYCVRSEAYVASGKPEGDGGDADCRLRVVSQQNSRSDDQCFRQLEAEVDRCRQELEQLRWNGATAGSQQV